MNLFESKPELLEITRKVVRHLLKNKQNKRMPFPIIVVKVIGYISKILNYDELSEQDKKLFKQWIRCLIDEID